MLTMMQGDQYRIPFDLRVNGTPVTPEELKDIEATVGMFSKTLSEGGVGFDENENEFYVYVTQEETFALRGDVKIQVRILFLSGDVVGVTLDTANIQTSSSKAVLK